MNYFDYDDLYEMIHNYYDIEHFNDFYKVFNDNIDWKNLSPASLQNIFIHFQEPQDLVNEIENNFDNFKQDYLR
jgi:acetone carboxylase gamma subunit